MQASSRVRVIVCDSNQPPAKFPCHFCRYISVSRDDTDYLLNRQCIYCIPVFSEIIFFSHSSFRFIGMIEKPYEWSLELDPACAWLSRRRMTDFMKLRLSMIRNEWNSISKPLSVVQWTQFQAKLYFTQNKSITFRFPGQIDLFSAAFRKWYLVRLIFS